MKEYLVEYIEAFGEVFNGGTSTPARATLFEIDDESGELDEQQKEISHHIVVKLLFVLKERDQIWILQYRSYALGWTRAMKKTGGSYTGSFTILTEH